MKHILNRRAAVGKMTLAIGLLGACPARALDFGPKQLPLSVAGVTVQVPVAGSIDARTTASAIDLDVSLVGDLGSVQDHALEIAHGIPRLTDNCAHQGVNVVVDPLQSAKITAVGNSASVELSGHVTVWACKKILGTNAKTKIGSDDVTILAPVELYTPDHQTIALRLSAPASIKTGHALTAEVAGVLVGDLNGLLNRELTQILNTAGARAAIPPLPGVAVSIENAAFAQNGAGLTARANGHATMSGAAFANLMGFIGR